MRTSLLCLVSVVALSACGLRGGLERPPPLWGNPPIEGPNDPRVLRQQEKEKAEKEAREKAERDAAARATPSPTATPQ